MTDKMAEVFEWELAQFLVGIAVLAAVLAIAVIWAVISDLYDRWKAKR